MSMSTYVRGFVPPDETWTKMKAIWDACVAARIGAPDEVVLFFAYENPDPAGVVSEITMALTASSADGQDHWEVDLDALRKHYPNVKRIRFTNGY